MAGVLVLAFRDSADWLGATHGQLGCEGGLECSYLPISDALRRKRTFASVETAELDSVMGMKSAAEQISGTCWAIDAAYRFAEDVSSTLAQRPLVVGL